MCVRLSALVSGHGEVEAVPVLVHRIAKAVLPGTMVTLDPVLRVPEAHLLKEGELERQVERAARKMRGGRGIFILIDCDRDGGCSATEGPALVHRARRARADMEISVVLAKKEYEAWFIAAAQSLRGKCGLPQDLVGAPDPENVRGAKEWLSRHMPRNRRYAETADQAALTSVFDMQVARCADSFDKCYREIARLLTVLGGR
ncbi:MAG: DUF4276 family protein [Planctomycetes bacterium]|nr:DUF4276 family protein [Planctomycetota bacterium]